jgi:hypothetical protein
MLVLLIRMSIAEAAVFEGILNSDSNDASNLNKYDEAIKAYDKVIYRTKRKTTGSSAQWM